MFLISTLIMSKYQNKYRIESARLKNWNYSNPGWYYVTINTDDHQKYFGKIIKTRIELNEIGKICKRYCEEIPIHYPNVELDFYSIMPNHLHGILILNPIVETGYIPSPNKTNNLFTL
jgi:REP-associated tyrosine transposase